MRVLIAAIAFLALSVTADAQKLLSREEFRDAAIALLRQEAPDVQIEIVDELAIVVTRPSDTDVGGRRVNFDSGYREYLTAPEQVDNILGRWSRLILSPVMASDHDRIISVLRHRDTANVAVGEQRVDLVWRPFAGDLIEILAFDSAEQIRYATTADLDETGLSVDAAWALTPANVRARMGPLQREALPPNMNTLSGENGITPSLLTVPDFCGPDTIGKLYLVADRNLIVIGNGRDRDDREYFMAFTRAAHAAGDSFSATPLECRDGRLQLAPR